SAPNKIQSSEQQFPESFMHAEPKTLLKQAIQKCLPVLQPLVENYTAPHQVWKREGEGRWSSAVEPRPDVVRVFITAEKEIREAGVPFTDSFLLRYPEYKGMVGFPTLGRNNFAGDGIRIFRSALGHLWRQHETFDLDEATVDGLVNEFEAF